MCNCRVEPRRLRQAIRAGSPLNRLLRQYTRAVVAQIAHRAGCNRHHEPPPRCANRHHEPPPRCANRHHEPPPRCANWLLMARDRGRVDRLPLTHGVLAELLGARRAAVTETMRKLEQAGVIDYARGLVFVRDRAGLEASSCRYHARVQEAYERALGAAARTPR